MARLETIDPASLPAAELAWAQEHRSLNRVLTLGHVPEFLAALRALETASSAVASLEPEVRATAALAVARRSVYEMRCLAPLAASAGLTDDMVQAIEDEDWTEPSFSHRQKAALQFSLKFDAGHGVQDAFFAEIRQQFSTREIVELSAICGCHGLLARTAIALSYDAE